MAQVPRVYTLAPTAPAALSRGVPSARVSTSTVEPIVESGASAAASFDAAPFGLTSDSHRQDGFRQGRTPQRQPQGAVINIASETFSVLMENLSGGVDRNGGPAVRGRQYGGSIGNAIKTYETNARVIHGEPPVTGTEISIRL